MEITTEVLKVIPVDLFDGAPDVRIDREEITIIGRVPATPAQDAAGDDTDRIDRFREATREQRMRIARGLEDAFNRKVAWGARSGEMGVLFTHLATPVMTRLRQPERLVLDTLVAGGVARSRADALAWCVRLVGQHEADWIARLQDAIKNVDEARASGPVPD